MWLGVLYLLMAAALPQSLGEEERWPGDHLVDVGSEGVWERVPEPLPTSLASLVVGTNSRIPLTWPDALKHSLTFCVQDEEGLLDIDYGYKQRHGIPMLRDVSNWRMQPRHTGSSQSFKARAFARALKIAVGAVREMCGVELRQVPSDKCIPPTSHTEIGDFIPEGMERVWFTIRPSHLTDRQLDGRVGDAPVIDVLQSWVNRKWGEPLSEDIDQFNRDKNRWGVDGTSSNVTSRGQLVWKVKLYERSTSGERRRKMATVQSVPSFALNKAQIYIRFDIGFELMVRTLVHELGHALGFLHEPQSPPQSEGSVVSRTESHSEVDLDHTSSATSVTTHWTDVFTVTDETKRSRRTSFDPNSFMGYGPTSYFPSTLDKAAASTLYGDPVDGASETTISYVTSHSGEGETVDGERVLADWSTTLKPAEFTSASLELTMLERPSHNTDVHVHAAKLPSLDDEVCRSLRSRRLNGRLLSHLYEIVATHAVPLRQLVQHSCQRDYRCEFVAIRAKASSLNTMEDRCDSVSSHEWDTGASKVALLVCGEPLRPIAAIWPQEQAMKMYEKDEPVHFNALFLEKDVGQEELKERDFPLCLQVQVSVKVVSHFNIHVGGQLQVFATEASSQRSTLTWNKGRRAVVAPPRATVGARERLFVTKEIEDASSSSDSTTFHAPISLTVSSAYVDNFQRLLEDIPSLQIVEADQVGLKRVSLSNSHNLVRVSLSRNYLESITVDPLGNIRLMHLDLSWNQLTEIPLPLVQLPNLRVLDVSHNDISSFPNLVDANVETRIMELNIGHNVLKTIPHQLLQHLPSLVSLDASNNFLSAISLDACAHKHPLMSLKFPNNLLRDMPFLPTPCVAHLEELDLSNNLLHGTINTTSPLPSLRTLSASSNEIDELSRECWKHISNLEKLDLSGNRLSSLPKAFSDILRLEFVNLDNNVLTTMPPSESLQHISATGNRLSHYTCTSPRLRSLVLSANAMEGLDLSVCLQSLEVLDVSRNNLQSFPSLANATALVDVDVTLNNISHIALPRGKTKMRRLWAAHNSLTSLSFDGRFSIESVDFSYNDLKMIDLSTMEGGSNFGNVDFSHNVLTEFPDDYIFKVHSLDVSHNVLEYFESGMIDVVRLFLSHNAIKFFVSGDHWSIGELDLSFNNMKAFFFGMIDVVSAPSAKIKLNANPVLFNATDYERTFHGFVNSDIQVEYDQTPMKDELKPMDGPYAVWHKSMERQGGRVHDVVWCSSGVPNVLATYNNLRKVSLRFQGNAPELPRTWNVLEELGVVGFGCPPVGWFRDLPALKALSLVSPAHGCDDESEASPKHALVESLKLSVLPVTAVNEWTSTRSFPRLRKLSLDFVWKTSEDTLNVPHYVEELTLVNLVTSEQVTIHIDGSETSNLRKFDCGTANIRNVDFLCNAPNLEELRMEKCGSRPPNCTFPMLRQLTLRFYDTIEGEVGILSHAPVLERLTVEWGNMMKLPESLSENKHLTHVNVRHNKLTSLPTFLSQVEVFQWNDNPISSIPSWLFPDEATVKIRNGGLEAVSGTLCRGSLPLSFITYSGNNVSQVASDAFVGRSCVNLESISLSDNRLSTLDGVVWPMSLKKVDLSGNHLTRIPTFTWGSAIASRLQLRSINLARNNITVTTHELKKLHHLRSISELILSGNNIPELPPLTRFLKKLWKLDVSHSGVVSLPASMGHLGRMRELDASHNSITKCTTQFPRHMKYLHLQHNKLTSIVLEGSHDFRVVDVSNNNMEEPPIIRGATVRRMDISFNPLRTLHGLSDHLVTSLVAVGVASTLEILEGDMHIVWAFPTWCINIGNQLLQKCLQGVREMTSKVPPTMWILTSIQNEWAILATAVDLRGSPYADAHVGGRNTSSLHSLYGIDDLINYSNRVAVEAKTSSRQVELHSAHGGYFALSYKADMKMKELPVRKEKSLIDLKELDPQPEAGLAMTNRKRRHCMICTFQSPSNTTTPLMPQKFAWNDSNEDVNALCALNDLRKSTPTVSTIERTDMEKAANITRVCMGDCAFELWIEEVRESPNATKQKIRAVRMRNALLLVEDSILFMDKPVSVMVRGEDRDNCHWHFLSSQ